MSKDWYLLRCPHETVSGFENELMGDIAEDGFMEVLQTDIADTVEICNYNLSDCKSVRAIIQNNVQDTRLKTLSRAMLAPIGTCEAGMYVKYKNCYWIIIGLVDDNKIYEKAILTLCNYLLTWINKEGKIIQRWVNASSASQYNSGETSTKHYVVRSDQLLVYTPDDDECLLLDSGVRFVMDKRCKIYEKRMGKDITQDTSNPVITYSLTRADTILYDYQDSGHYAFMANQTEQHEKDGYYVVDGKGYWLCKEPVTAEGTELGTAYAKIEYESLELYNGLDEGCFIATFYDESGNKETVIPKWQINCDFVDMLSVSEADNTLFISADNKSLINKPFELSLSAEGFKTDSVTVTIRAFI